MPAASLFHRQLAHETKIPGCCVTRSAIDSTLKRRLHTLIETAEFPASGEISFGYSSPGLHCEKPRVCDADIPAGPLLELRTTAASLPGALLFGPFEFNQCSIRTLNTGDALECVQESGWYGDTVVEFALCGSLSVAIENDDRTQALVLTLGDGDALLVTGECRSAWARSMFPIIDGPVYTITFRMV